jgi:hypothetical protein
VACGELRVVILKLQWHCDIQKMEMIALDEEGHTEAAVRCCGLLWDALDCRGLLQLVVGGSAYCSV